MSLIAWYPLNGNLNNQGVGDMDLTISTNPTYVDSKFGKGTTNVGIKWTAKLTALILNNKALTIAFWIKVTGSNYGILFGNESTLASNNRKFSIFQYPTANSLHLSWLNDVANATFLGCLINEFFPTNEWVHCCITYDGTKAIIYKNGIKHSEYNGISNSSTFEYETNVINNRAGRILNDLRFYDHALSPKEVKEISKGLVLHYPLNLIDGYIGGRNLILGSANLTPSTTYILNLSYLNTLSGKTCTLSFEYEANNWIGNRFGFEPNLYTTTNNYCPCWVNGSANGYGKRVTTFVVPSNITRLILNTCYIQGTTQGSVKIYNFKLEVGSKATAWITAPEDIGQDSAIYDCSGFNEPGYFSELLPEWSDDSPIGYGSTFLNGATVDSSSNVQTGVRYLIGKCNVPSTNKITFAWWGKIHKYGRGGIFETLNNINDIFNNNNFSLTAIANWDNTFRIYNGTTGVNLNIHIIKDNNTWRHNVITYDGSNVKCYINGELVLTTALTGNLPTFTGIIMGLGKAGGVWRLILEQVADVRIYVTPLSADDVKELYQTRFSITDNGTMYCTEYVELDSIKTNSNGILNSQYLNELDIPTKNMEFKKESDGSIWARIFYHNNRNGTKYFVYNTDYVTLPVIIDDDRYSMLYLMEKFKYDNKFELMACLPDDGGGVWRWILTNNPVTSTSAGTVTSVTGYLYDSAGLMKCSGNTWLAHTSSSGNWWCAIGCLTKYGNGIPGWGGITVTGGLELWARIDKLPLNNKVSIYNDTITTREIIEN